MLNLKDIDWDEFIQPPKSFGPTVRWWWTGLDVEQEELVKEVQELDEAGFLGAEIQVFMIGSPMGLEKKDMKRVFRSHRFMQPYYYEMIKVVLEEASKRDMIIDITIGSSWPAGGTHITKDDSMKVLLIGQKIIKGPIRYVGELPQFQKPPNVGLGQREFFKEDMRVEAVVAAKPIGKPGEIKYKEIETAYLDKESIIILTDKVEYNNILDWQVPEGDWQIFAFYKGPSGSIPLFDCRSSPNKNSLVLDHLSSNSIRKHLDVHLGEGKKYFGNYYGNTLRAFFTDSLELSSDWLWTDNFLEQFKKRRGYDLTPFLPVCFVPNRDNKFLQAFIGGETPCFDFKDDSGDKIRYDFEKTISDLFSEEFVQTMTDWANKYKLKSRIQAYGIRADTLKCFGIAHIPETEQLYAGGIIDFLKLAGSAGLIYEKPIVTAESIVWNQRDYMTTPLKWKVAADRLFISGINQMIYHGFPYQNPLFPYPGYCGFSTPYLPNSMNFSSNFSRMNPFYEYFPLMNKYITRCQYALQHGKTVSNVAIFYPVFNYCDSILKKEELVGGCLDENDAPLAKGQTNAHLKNKKNLDSNEKWTLSLINLADNLTANGFYYTHVNEESILNSKVKENKVLIGGAKFEVLILPNVDAISLDLATKLNDIAASGIPIIFINILPKKQPGYLDFEVNDKEIEGIIKNLIEKKKSYYVESSINIAQYIIEYLEIKPGILYEGQQPSIYYIHKATENSDCYFLRHSTNQPINISMKFSHFDKIPFILNPWTGEISQAVQYKQENGHIKMHLHFDAYDSYIIEFRKSKKEFHIVESPTKTKRINNKIFGLIETTGQFLVKLSNDSEKVIKIENEIPPTIPLKKWDFKTQLRDHLGNFTPIHIYFEELKDWRNILELKYCSSKGVYTSKFSLDEKYIQEDLKLILNLGRVHDVAVVKINKIDTQPLLFYPYEVDISDYVKTGENIIEIIITPTLRNRLIGYGKKGGKNWKNHKRKKEFMPSGLIGPVIIKPVKMVEII